ncbi:hypothetical protein [Alicyclobacillus sp. SO9]|uniref:hypothetical protein n=1 Tax=Alicyclobacillus sp. SO9 TaxID=2665646 RepID=UPI0018E7E0C6|nr:hypothetical protein [Alicyclobacillus sp. SO9]QQE80245.1 hypothetical protein GI364_07400 [Alicyclobacillus sp. SO9]
MKHQTYSLYYNTMNRWLVTNVDTTEVKLPMSTHTYDGNLNDWLVKGFALFENPEREAFINRRRRRRISYPNLLSVPQPGQVFSDMNVERTWEIYIPWNNRNVESSGFWRNPTLLSQWAYTRVYSDDPQLIRLRIRTCGGVCLWLNGAEILRFEPYTRNEDSEIEVNVTLDGGLNDFIVYHEDLAERDTLFKFRIDAYATCPLSIHLPIGDVNGDNLSQLELAVNNAYFRRDTLRSGDVELRMSNPLKEDLTVHVDNQIEWGKRRSQELLWRKQSSSLVLGTVDDFDVGVNFFGLEFSNGSVRLKRQWMIQIYPSWWSTLEAPSVSQRKSILLKEISRHGRRDAHHAYAMLVSHGSREEIEDIMGNELSLIDQRSDCSDFSLIVMFRFYLFSLDNPDWNNLRHRIKQSILGFRYWFDEPGNDVMWFFSENHALLFHTCELLAGQLFPDETFSNSGLLGREHVELAKERLFNWFSRFRTEGLAEWNSAPYIPIDVMGLLELRDLTQDPALKQQASQALDNIFEHICANSLDGILSCSQGRTYEKDLKATTTGAIAALLWLSYGIGAPNPSSFGVVSLCVSDYKPPHELQKLIVTDKQSIVYQCHQGPDKHADLYTFKIFGAILSTAPSFRRGKNGYSEHVLHAALSSEAMVWVNHPGESDPNGTGRPGYWAGNGTLPHVGQYRGVAVALYQIGECQDISYTHAYFPKFAFDSVVARGQWVFGQVGHRYIALWVANGFEWIRTGAGTERELVSSGRKNTWVLAVGSDSDFTNYNDFMDKYSSIAFTDTPGEQISFRDPRYGFVNFGWKSNFEINNQRVRYSGFGPHPRIEHYIKEG